MIKIRFYRDAGRWDEFKFWSECQEWNPFIWNIQLFCWGIIIYFKS